MLEIDWTLETLKLRSPRVENLACFAYVSGVTRRKRPVIQGQPDNVGDQRLFNQNKNACVTFWLVGHRLYS